MKNMVIGIFLVFIMLALAQPFVEFSSLLTDKVTLDAAVLNSSRAARNDALQARYIESMSYLGDLDANIIESLFRESFAEAFSKTLGVNLIESKVNRMVFSGNDRWNEITIDLTIDFEESDLHGHTVIDRAIVGIEVDTAYVYRTSLLAMMAAATGDTHRVNIGARSEPFVFTVQIVN